MKSEIIKEYLNIVNFKSGNWSIKQLEEALKAKLHETPGIDVKWAKDALLNEDTGKPEVYEYVEKISIVYTDVDDKIKKIEFLVK
jgi:hypothetical protein